MKPMLTEAADSPIKTLYTCAYEIMNFNTSDPLKLAARSSRGRITLLQCNNVPRTSHTTQEGLLCLIGKNVTDVCRKIIKVYPSKGWQFLLLQTGHCGVRPRTLTLMGGCHRTYSHHPQRASFVPRGGLRAPASQPHSALLPFLSRRPPPRAKRRPSGLSAQGTLGD